MQFKRLNNAIVTEKYSEESLRDQKASATIVHLGIGAFHRAHQAVYTNNANVLAAQAVEDIWSIIGVSLRSATVRDQLVPQDCFYNVVESDVSGSNRFLVSAIENVLVAPENPQAVLDAMCAEKTQIVSLTVTEKGYCHDVVSGDLNLQNLDIQHDLANLDSPKTAIGFIVAALKYRHDNALPAFTVLSCDNLPSNGKTLAKVVLQFAEKIHPALAAWIEQQAKFPNTMIDRIVPATTADDIDKFSQRYGYHDLAMVKTERFSQWVIEDNFVGKRPAWQKVGANIVNDVDAYENAKLRLLNGAHSSLAYIGYLTGLDFVHQVMENPELTRFLTHLMKVEIAPTIVAPQGLDLQQYCDDLLQRFSNPELHHRTYQIAMDGSQKVPQRLLHTVEYKLKNNQAFDGLSFAIAGWLRYTMGVDEAGAAIEVQDPRAEQLAEIYKQHANNSDELINAYLHVHSIFPESLQSYPAFKESLNYWVSLIQELGAKAALDKLLERVEAAVK
ncbi:MAG: mannitol dehydrogenase family protein [Paraglaciecola sp.]|uniref:mannitol dehydrogenase family protein n=1 Tax=Paraglaciecola sp. TaxID=1920173 RepID=UPI0032974C4D